MQSSITKIPIRKWIRLLIQTFNFSPGECKFKRIIDNSAIYIEEDESWEQVYSKIEDSLNEDNLKHF